MDPPLHPSTHFFFSYLFLLCAYKDPCHPNCQIKHAHVLCVDTGRSSETAKAHRG
eukprot:TRINITY_DN3876_c0_g1_i1.p3 TRINITY_DN3876_c0_g1~~TRINITY_DN3876_c0_g1_i1.p3  ORF type:complete len:55 (+),score=4.52 TRINITY_DN3876_c0_g1_i1:330-494(+)